MRQREDDMVMVTGQEPRVLEGQPALGLEVRALRTGPVPTGVIPDAGHMTVRTRLHMSTEGSSPALHEGMRGSPDVTRQRMRLLVGQIRIFEDGLERHEAHQCLRTREGSILGLF